MTFANLRFSGVPAMLPLLNTAKEIKLLGPLHVEWDGDHLWIPKGFKHDGPSVPRWLRGLFPYSHKLLRAAIAHDFVCREKPKGWTLRRASAFFLACMKVDGVGWIKRRAMYAGVSTGIGQSWPRPERQVRDK